MRKTFLNFITLVMLSLLVSACGQKPQVVTGIQVQTSTVNQDVYLSVKADLNLGNMSFPTVILPIIDPHGQTNYGSVELLPVLGGKNQMKISVNVSALAHIQATQARLPNGNAIPLIANNPTITIPLGSGAQLYLTLGANAVAIGVAVPIKTFDSIGSSVSGISLFPTFMIDQVMGAAGIFTGAQAGQNGFALVADVTGYVRMQDIYIPGGVTQAKLSYTAAVVPAAKEEKINKMIYDLHKKGKRLELRK